MIETNMYKIERGAVLLPNSVVPPGRVIPSGQVWGGATPGCTFVRELTQQEMNDNYMASYSKGAISEDSSFSLYPRGFDQDKTDETAQDYAERNYFANIKQ